MTKPFSGALDSLVLKLIRKPMLLAMCGALVVAAAFDTAWVPPAVARPQYKKAFDARYVQPDSRNASEATLACRVKTAGCAVCHARDEQGKVENSVRNAYGNAFGENLGRRSTQDGPRIRRALDAAERAKPDAKQGEEIAGRDASPTFGQRIFSGQLPIGDE